MKALLLAAGAGTRLRPLTHDRPKPMVEIAGEPAIARSLRWLQQQGVTDVAVNLHYRPGVIRKFVGDGARFGVRVRYSLERPILGTSGALRPLASFFRNEEVFLVLYGDVLTNLELRPVLCAHEMANAVVTIVLTKVEDPTRAGVVGFDSDCFINRFVEKPLHHEVFSQWANAGIYLCSPTILAYVAAKGSQDFAHDVFPAMLRDGRRLLASPTRALVIDFGSPERREFAERAIRAGSLARRAVPEQC